MTWLNSETDSGTNSSAMIWPPTSGREGFGPGRCQLAEIVVRGQRVAARAELLDHVLHHRNDLLLADRAGAEGVGVRDSAFVLVGVEVELLELIHDRADRLALGGSKAGHQHVDLVLLDQATCKLLPQSVVALSVDREEVDFAPQDTFVTGIDENIGILVEYHLGSALVPARVNDVESHPLLADSRRFLRDVARACRGRPRRCRGPL